MTLKPALIYMKLKPQYLGKQAQNMETSERKNSISIQKIQIGEENVWEQKKTEIKTRKIRFYALVR